MGDKKGTGSVIPYLKGKGRFASHCWGAFVCVTQYLVFDIEYLGSGVSFDFDDSNGYHGWVGCTCL